MGWPKSVGSSHRFIPPWPKRVVPGRQIRCREEARLPKLLTEGKLIHLLLAYGGRGHHGGRGRLATFKLLKCCLSHPDWELIPVCRCGRVALYVL